jgi:hypothetical protein
VSGVAETNAAVENRKLKRKKNGAHECCPSERGSPLNCLRHHPTAAQRAGKEDEK